MTTGQAKRLLSHFATQRCKRVKSFDSSNPETHEILPSMRSTAANLPLIRWSWPYWDLGNREFEMQRPKPLVTPFPEFRYGNSCMRSMTLVDLDLMVTIPPELKGVERHSVLIMRRGFVYRDFTTCEDEGSCPLVSRMPKRRNLFTLNRLIHRAHQGFVYRDFVTCEDEGSCPLVSRMPKRPKLIHTKPAHPQSASGFRIPGFYDLRR
jgi:hypothetical protein